MTSLFYHLSYIVMYNSLQTVVHNNRREMFTVQVFRANRKNISVCCPMKWLTNEDRVEADMIMVSGQKVFHDFLKFHLLTCIFQGARKLIILLLLIQFERKIYWVKVKLYKWSYLHKYFSFFQSWTRHCSFPKFSDLMS